MQMKGKSKITRILNNHFTNHSTLNKLTSIKIKKKKTALWSGNNQTPTIYSHDMQTTRTLFFKGII